MTLFFAASLKQGQTVRADNSGKRYNDKQTKNKIDQEQRQRYNLTNRHIYRHSDTNRQTDEVQVKVKDRKSENKAHLSVFLVSGLDEIY